MLMSLRLVNPETLGPRAHHAFATSRSGRLGAMAHRRGHAIVIGASMGGLLAARAVAEHYDRVTVIERDELPEAAEPRKGVPQGRHTHALLARGREGLEQLFPGLTEELVAEGAIRGDIVADVIWFNYGCSLCNAPSALVGLAMSRPLLENGVRRRLLRLPNVCLRQCSEVEEPVFDHSQDRVAGVRVRSRDGADGVEALTADLVVDATGRGSRCAAWLNALGYAAPREEKIEVGVGYMTRLYRRRPEQLNGKFGALFAASRPDWRVGFIVAQEGERWTVTLGGYLGDHPPADEEGFLEFARSLQRPDIFQVIREAEKLSPLMPYRFGTNLRRHYAELDRFPQGFLVYGDALCSFNPVYGQGMTVAIMESLALRQCLAAGTDDIARRFFRAADRLIDIPWQIAVGSDLQHPGVQGKRPVPLRFFNWYIAQLFRAAQADVVLTTRFLETLNLIRQPAALLEPQMALRVWSGNRRRARDPRPPIGKVRP
jgi:2-polyprenyl-6-methoxyphenol hydroxylase-like FAD-dependent oxidoreductase